MVNRSIADITRATAYDANGEKLGPVKEVYVNDTTGEPDFIEIGHGLFGMGSSLVPLRGHRFDGEDLRLAFDQDRIKDAPDIDHGAHLSSGDQDAIYRHFGLESTENVTTYDTDVQRDREGYGTTDDLREKDAMIRSEERLNVDKDRVTTGEVRLRKHVVHDTETVEVPVEREEVRLERTPVDADDARAARGDTLGDEEASVTLHEERVNVTKETIPVEKINLDKKIVRDTETVHEDIAREEIEVDDEVSRHNRDAR